MLDIDHFKQINDRFGHQQGDRALQRFCACVAAQLRADDLFVRSGGEEFLILLPGMSEPDLLALAERIRAAVAALPAEPAAFTVSLGTTLVRPGRRSIRRWPALTSGSIGPSGPAATGSLTARWQPAIRGETGAGDPLIYGGQPGTDISDAAGTVRCIIN